MPFIKSALATAGATIVSLAVVSTSGASLTNADIETSNIVLAQTTDSISMDFSEDGFLLEFSKLFSSSIFTGGVERIATFSGCILTVRQEAADSCTYVGNSIIGTAAITTELDISVIDSIILQANGDGGSINFLGQSESHSDSFIKTYESCSGENTITELKSGALLLLEDESWGQISEFQPEDLLARIIQSCKGL